MNPPPADGEEAAYAGSEPLDTALADRFAFVLEIPDWQRLGPELQETLILTGNSALTAETGRRLAQHIETGRALAARIRESMSGVLARYIRLVCALLRQSGIGLSPRRAVMLLRNIAGVHAARVLAYPGADPSLSAITALRHSLPQRATGHPDKLCDAIADALVEEAARREKRALCGIEVAVHRASVFITGRIACAGAESIPVEEIARECYRSAGYVDGWFPSPGEVEVRTNLCLGPLTESESAFREVSDDQSIVTGYAVDSPGTNWLPPEHWLVWRLSRCVQRLRADDPELALGPDGKVVLVYDSEKSALSAFSASVQQKIGGSEIDLHRAVRDAVAGELRECAGAIPGFRACLPEQFHVNGAGNFEVGGPEGDNGLSGKKLVVDAYGPRVPIGGGALSGKDFFKADRAGAILARRLARTVVAAGLAGECIATLAIFPGDLAFRIISVRDGKGASLDPARWAALMDLSLGAAGERYALTQDLLSVARHGHFTSADHPWEEIRF